MRPDVKRSFYRHRWMIAPSLGAALLCAGNVPAAAHDDGLHFSHPLIAESPSPDTKARFDYAFRSLKDGAENFDENAVNLEGEYAFSRAFSIEVDIPYAFVDATGEAAANHFDTVSIGFKFANFVLEDKGVLLGYGFEIGTPTGDEEKGIGDDHLVELEPFFDIGYKRGDLEVVAFTSFGIPINQQQGEEVETEMAYNLSLLYHVTPRFMTLLEFDGMTVLSGEEDGATLVNITPGVKIKPLADRAFEVGVGISLPLTNTRLFDVRALVSAFYHF